MRSPIRNLLVLSLSLSIFAISVFGVDDLVPDEVNIRVARISVAESEVQIRRAGIEDWETAELNLPVVEGDEIATGDGEAEIQIDSKTYIRLAPNSYLKMIALKDAGIALSLPQGSAIIRLNELDLTREYFEVDAPMTTVAFQSVGLYRIDSTADDVRITVNVGEAQVYSDDSGFKLREGRSAKVALTGNFAGEWETVAASRINDSFSEWSDERDEIIAELLNDAHYDRYYDQDIYGAEDLSDNGNWSYLSDYGYVWSPASHAINSYSNWSPYRYGSWRWIPAFGWTWINAEPWGWATYHHGRWFFHNGRWFWSPYGAFRNGRSWWRPALVVMQTWGSSVCWYPLPYGYGYYNYNYHYYNYGGYYGGGGHHNGPPRPHVSNPNPTPTPGVVPGPTPKQDLGPSAFADNEARRKYKLTPPLQTVPQTGVISMPISGFGRADQQPRPVTADTAKTVLSEIPDGSKPAPVLPTYKDLGSNGTKTTVARPIVKQPLAATKTGAAERKDGQSMDATLKNATVFGNRTPIPAKTDTRPTSSPVTRDTGAVSRPVVRTPSEPVRVPQTTVRDTTSRPSEPVRVPQTTVRDATSRPSEPVRVPQPTVRTPQNDARPAPPVRQAPVRQAPPPVRQAPVRQAPPPVRSSPPPAPKPAQAPRPSPPAPKPAPSKSSDNGDRKGKG